MKQIRLDAKEWKTQNDFYDAFFRAVGAPSWHGRNFDALNDSIGAGQINKVEVPYGIVIANGAAAKGEAQAIIHEFANLIRRLAEGGCPVQIVVRP
jgi:RNAse (barnase) inhibitor barstar